MHILINGWFLGEDTAGSGQYLHHLLHHLPQHTPAHRYHLVVPPGRKPTLFPAIEVTELPVPRLPRNLAKLWWEQVTMPQRARALRADVLWVPYWAAPLWQPRPTVVTVHDLIPQLVPAYRGGWLQRLYTALVGLSARRATAILTVSHAAARDVVAHLRVPGERVHVVYHGPNQEGALPPDEEILTYVRQKYGLPARFFLYLGGFDVRKNVPLIVHAYARYLALGGDPRVKLVIAGKLPATDTVFAPDPTKTAAELNLKEQVRFCGWIEEADKPALYALATAYLFPSLYEGFGMTVVEAMGWGSPVMTSAEYGMRNAE